MSETTVAPPIPGLFIVEDAVWKIKADGRIVNRLTGELHPDQIRDREAEKPRAWIAGGKRWTVNEAGQVCDADTWLVLVDHAAMPDLDDDDREDCVFKLRYQPEVADAITPEPRQVAS